MIRNKTLKGVYDIFNQIADIHSGIHGYGAGNVLNINAETSLKHPTLWVDIQPSTIQNNVITMNFLVYVFDVTDEGDFADPFVQSETLFLLNDVILKLKKVYKLIPETYEYEATPFTHKFGDRVAGWFTPLQVRVPLYYGECDIPVNWDIFDETFDDTFE